MISTEKLSREEIAERGDEIYDTRIGPNIKDENPYWYVLIDVTTGDYEVDASGIAASDRLLARRPDAQVWFRRVGSRYASNFGAHCRSGVR
jgi:hypothetical protein